ncbi:hypothetical protein [Nostoc sp.]
MTIGHFFTWITLMLTPVATTGSKWRGNRQGHVGSPTHINH